MYAGTTLRNSSGRIIGAHQKLDRVARKALEQTLLEQDFPTISEILHFEGKNGPDGIKSKSPAQDEPWHYYNPLKPRAGGLVQMIERHSKNLTTALRKNSREKAAFEAAWLAHALVDGLTPAHHFPLEETLEEMRGEGIETRTTIKDKLIVRSEGDTRRQVLAKNWKFWGAKGIMTTHFLFEIGIATTIAPLRLRQGYPSAQQQKEVLEKGIIDIFKQAALDIYERDLYERFARKGWTRQLAREIREMLAPTIVRVIALAWYEAAYRAQEKE
jgi:hypothetical protein